LALFPAYKARLPLSVPARDSLSQFQLGRAIFPKQGNFGFDESFWDVQNLKENTEKCKGKEVGAYLS